MMGAWGEGLYDDDEACDVRDIVALLSKMPRDGDAILDLLLEQFGRDEDLTAEGCPTFWMTVADQFAKRGIESGRAMDRASAAIDSGFDLADLEARGMEARGLQARRKVHEKLRERMANPKPAGARRTPKSPPAVVVEAGEVYRFPTMNGSAMNAWFSSWAQAGFVPDGWGALIILATGRVFDWFPWAAYTPVVVHPGREPAIQEVLEARTLLPEGVAYAAPKRSHLKKMGMTLAGRVALDPAAVEELRKLCHETPRHAVVCDWSVCSGALSRSDPGAGVVAVRTLLAGDAGE